MCSGCQWPPETGECYCEDHGGDGTAGYFRTCMIRVPDNAHATRVRGCDAGCIVCLDQPNELLYHAAWISSMPGKRPFLRPSDTLPNLDARGKLSDLQASRPHLVSSIVRYDVGACADNGAWSDHHPVPGREGKVCYGSPCACWRGAEAHRTMVPSLGRCPDGTNPGFPVSGMFAEGLFFAGDAWAPRATGSSLYCRRFYDEGPRTVRAFPPLDRHTSRYVEGQTVTFRESFQHSTWNSTPACAANWLVLSSGYVVKSECDGAFIDTPYFEAHKGQTYMQNVTLPCRYVADQVAITGNTACFRVGGYSGADSRVTAIRNAALALVPTHQFESENQYGEPVFTRFDQLDHRIASSGHNGDLGFYSRSWDGREFGIDDPRLPVVATFPHSRIKWSGVGPFTAELVITRVEIVVHVLLLKTSERSGDWWAHGIEPHTVATIDIDLGLRITTPIAVPIHYAPYSRWPTVGPEGNTLLLAQEPHQYIRPPAHVRWRGQLNYHSQPSLIEQGFRREVPTGSYAGIVHNAITAVSPWTVPGMPSMIDGKPDDPNQLFDGALQLDYRPTQGYEDCDQ